MSAPQDQALPQVPLQALNEDAVPRFGQGMKFRHDKVRDAWVILGPERLFQPDPVAAEILKLVDGQKTIGAIIDELVSRFAAPREVIAADVVTMFADMSAKGAIRL
ncbi:Coenzyme PQQ synthesis protein D [Granulibacter bethesdensis]|uniref:Coenzyme PQQ synthesis protein D n=1 Tax=Granulibacter bethesdensis TaxID=364410 RepID=A0AAC9KD75_9PROT|nr:pyrroloquinoline quinone biosynthesis peptide chaperone PqqD [Granulibacter bethesdensis]APH55243.1 Coenzyme PQQ synthesis protein D [Granulibacter bethesdensis]APH62830.1 Coenzyme PQQ synthesis protein D [Granulibacter bethesdensis]